MLQIHSQDRSTELFTIRKPGNIGSSLQDMLTQNQIIETIRIHMPSPYNYLSFLTTGLSCNNSLQEVNASVQLSESL